MSNILLSFCIPTYDRPERISAFIKYMISFQSDEIENYSVNLNIYIRDYFNVKIGFFLWF